MEANENAMIITWLCNGQNEGVDHSSFKEGREPHFTLFCTF